MVLIIFAYLYILENVFIYKYAKRMLGDGCIPGCITDIELERIRKKVNSKFSKF